jgi:hypothetical protein
MRHRHGDRRLGQALKVRRGWPTRPSGRAWINGREVGGTDPHYVHLSDWLD